MSSAQFPRWFPRGIGLLAPAAGVLALVFILPMCGIAILSFHPSLGKGRVGTDFTLHNYVAFFSDPFYLGVVWNSIKLSTITVVVTLLLGYPTAYFLARTQSRLRGLLNFLVFAPLLVSILIRNLGWLPLLSLDGTINTILLRLGLTSEPLLLASNATGVTIGLVHALLPYMILTLAGVIRSIGPEIEEASINLGAGPIETFFRVVLPLSRPGVIAGSLLVFTLAVGAYTTPAIMGGNRVLVMPTYIAQQMRTLLNYPLGATAAMVLLFLTALLMIVSVWVAERRDPLP
jgi:putative spermidine/putrescine transport system permease protein